MTKLMVIFSSFLAGCASLFYMMRTARKKGIQEEKNNNLNKFYENVEKARKTENNNGGLNSATIYSRMRSREKNNK